MTARTLGGEYRWLGLAHYLCCFTDQGAKVFRAEMTV
jgi:hypothetical protein